MTATQRLTIVLATTLLAGTARAGTVSEGASRFVGFFRWSAAVPADVGRALELYRRGDVLHAAAAADAGLRAEDAGPFREELLLVRSLALAERGWSRDAEDGFRAILEADAPSPYYPLALLGLIESRHRQDRVDEVVDAYERYWERPWRDGDRRARKIRNLLAAYGDVRAPRHWLTESEADLVARPSELARAIELCKDRVTERLLYLAGVDLFRAGEYSRSLEALERIGLVSLYFPYALYTSAQDHYALGDVDEAQTRVALL